MKEKYLNIINEWLQMEQHNAWCYRRPEYTKELEKTNDRIKTVESLKEFIKNNM